MTRARDIASLLDSGGDIVRSALDNAELVDDTSPELAADLDVLTSSIVSSSNRDITITPNGTGSVVMSKVDINAGAIDGVTIGSAVAGGSTFSSVSTGTLSATLGADFNNIHIENNAITSTNSNGNIALTPNGVGEVDISKVDIDAGAVDGITLGTNSAVTEAQVDNININGNAITSTDTDGNIAITPNGTGEVDISKVDIDAGTIDGVTIGGSSAGAGTFTTLSATTLGSSVDLDSQALTNANIDSGAIDGVTLGTNSAVTQAQIDNINIDANSIISTNTNGNIILTPNGTGNVSLGTLTFDADQTVGVGQDNYVLTYDNTSGTIGLEAATGGGGGGISNVVEDTSPQLGGSLDVNGQAIVSVSNGNIALTPDGTGEVDISKVDIDAGAIDGTTIGASSAAAGTFTTLSATTLGSAVDLNNQALTNADINSGAIDGVTLGTNSAVTEAQVDNININGNTVSSTNTDGDITLDPNGTGYVVIPADIGIGTTSPAARIHIEDSNPNIRLEDTDANGHVQLSANNSRGGLRIQLDPDNVDSSTDLRVEVDGSEVARFDASGLSFDTGSNHLNDYEEGTWTLTPQTNSGTAASIGTASGIYTRVGRLVTVTGIATNITPGGTSGSIFRIGGLPFTPANENSTGSAVWENITFQGASRFYFAPQARIAGYIQFSQCGDNNTDTAIDHGDLDAGGTSDIQFTVTYMV